MKKDEEKSTLKLIGLAGGIMTTMVLYGVFQERIMTRPYRGDDEAADGGGSLFLESAFLVLLNRLIASFLALFAIIATNRTSLGVLKEELKPAVPIWYFALVSCSNISATWCQYEALKFVNFPTQTLGKTGKMIPVMILGVLIHKKHYGIKDIASNLLITLGCTSFVLGGSVGSNVESNTPKGVGLMITFLFLDGFTSTLQEWLFKGNRKMSIWNQMLFVNLCSALISIVLLFLSGGMFRAFAFITEHPALLRDALLLSLCAASGQMCIYSLIKSFGALVLAGVMVTRQVISMLLSYILWKHNLTVTQLFSAIVVFVTLSALEYTKANHSKKHDSSLPVSQKQNNQDQDQKQSQEIPLVVIDASDKSKST